MKNASLPSRGLAFGDYPQRAGADDTAAFEGVRRWLLSRFARPAAGRLPDEVTLSLRATRERLRGLDTASFECEIGRARLRLCREGLEADTTGVALAVAGEAMARTLGRTPYDTQFHAAWLMLNNCLVEMATGEGKTLATALAAAVAALGGAPVHVLTANDYLVRRDRQDLEPFYASLSLSCDCITAGMAASAHAQAWQRDVVYTTARELVFDYLRDHLALRGERDARVLRAKAIVAADEAGAGPGAAAPALPGLCLCFIDEADSLLLDEAVVPLVISAPTQALDAQAYLRAYEISCTLQRERDYTLVPARRALLLTDAGRERVTAEVEGAAGVLAPARRACELVEAGLAARLLYRRDREYAVADGKLQLIDELTGRIAQGRQWQGALQAMVELKEGLAPSLPTATAAQITYQRFFPRYLRLGGMSGSLLESRHELRVLYGAPVARVPLATPSRRRWLGLRVCADAAHKWRSVLQSVRLHTGAGRPVLVGTDSVADSAQLSELLQAGGVPHQLLNATQDAAEAERIALAGTAAMVTVATNIAGRGTDIRLDAAAQAHGGLHVIATMRNRSRRIDRQLIGRAARHGDPGSAEAVLALDDALLTRVWPAGLLRAAAACSRGPRHELPLWLARPLFAVAQRITEGRDRAQRRDLRHADRRAAELYGFSGGTE